MPRKVYIIENLDCANCAAKIEAKMNALPEVEAASITFATRQLRITAKDPDALHQLACIFLHALTHLSSTCYFFQRVSFRIFFLANFHCRS